MAILKAMADSSGEELYMFADDFKDFFNQYRVAAHQRYLTCMLWFNLCLVGGSRRLSLSPGLLTIIILSHFY